MTMPLPSSRKIKASAGGLLDDGANPGLVWNKLFSGWGASSARWSDTMPGAPDKKRWIDEFTERKGEKGKKVERTHGDEGLIARAVSRQRALAERLGGMSAVLATEAPFVTGMGLAHPVENGFSWHHVLGVPYLPASSLKGVARAWATHWANEATEEINRIFGPPMDHADHGNAGDVIFFDMLPVAPVGLMCEVLTPHDGGWRQGNADAPSDWHSPVPIPFLAVRPEMKFLCCVAPRPGGGSAGDVRRVLDWLKAALSWLGAGAKTATGFGRLADEQSRPLAEGDRVELTVPAGKGNPGDTGTIERIFTSQEVAQVKLDKGGMPTVSLGGLKRLSG